MAVTKIWAVKDSLPRVVNYVKSPKKTDAFILSGLNCEPGIAAAQMQAVKRQFQKEDGILAFHAVQSFQPGEIDAAKAHEIGMKLAKKMWSDRFQIIVATHVDRQHVHTHFVVNSVSFVDGCKYYDNKANYRALREISDEFCREYGLSIIEPEGRGKQYAEWQAEKNGADTWRGVIRAEIDTVIAQANSMEQFLFLLKKRGYAVATNRKHWTLHPPGKERNVRFRSLGAEYLPEEIAKRIKAHGRVYTPQEKRRRPKTIRKYYRGTFAKNPLSKITGLRALYFKYMYMLGHIKKRQPYNKEAAFLLREETRRLRQYAAQGRLLNRYRIESQEQLSAFAESIEEKLIALAEKRKSLHAERRRTGDASLKPQTDTITAEMRELRRDLKLCEQITERVPKMRHTLELSRNERTRQRERTKEMER